MSQRRGWQKTLILPASLQKQTKEEEAKDRVSFSLRIVPGRVTRPFVAFRCCDIEAFAVVVWDMGKKSEMPAGPSGGGRI